MMNVRCAARDLHTIAPGPLECTCWRWFAALWGDCKKSRKAPLNALIIIIILKSYSHHTHLQCLRLLKTLLGLSSLDTTPEWKIIDGLLKSTEWQIKGVRSVWRPKHPWRDDIVGQHRAVWTSIAKDREKCRTLVEGYFLQWKDTAWNRIDRICQDTVNRFISNLVWC